jgi:hypothetical protein
MVDEVVVVMAEGKGVAKFFQCDLLTELFYLFVTIFLVLTPLCWGVLEGGREGGREGGSSQDGVVVKMERNIKIGWRRREGEERKRERMGEQREKVGREREERRENPESKLILKTECIV